MAGVEIYTLKVKPEHIVHAVQSPALSIGSVRLKDLENKELGFQGQR